MNKTMLLASAAALFAFNANALEFRPYVGADLGVSHIAGDVVDYMDLDENIAVAGLNIGFKAGKYFGMELSSGASSTSEADGFDTSYNSFGADVVGYLPLNEKTNLFGMVGVGNYEVEAETETKVLGYTVSLKGDKTVARFTLGADYALDDHVSFRGMVRYIPINEGDFDSLTEITAGIRYTF